MRVALVCIAMNEEHYIDEWIAYHKLLGFDRIFVYQNDWRYEITDELVQVEYMDGVAKQMAAYAHFVQHNHADFDWAAFIDVDEFICLKKHKDIKSFIAEQEKGQAAIAMNWRIFGSSYRVFDGQYAVLARFVRCGRVGDHHVKLIVRMAPNRCLVMSHCLNEPAMDTNGKLFTGPFNEDKPIDVVQLNHYACKTVREFTRRAIRRPALPGPRAAAFTDYDVNDDIDTTVLQFIQQHAQRDTFLFPYEPFPLVSKSRVQHVHAATIARQRRG